jgi:hypothetical protein
MVSSVHQYGNDNFYKWLEKLGYSLIDGKICSERSRVFMMTLHSDNPV